MAEVARQQLVDRLQSDDSASRLQALRCIKNCVIGNRRQKQHYIHLDAVKLLVAVLASPTADAAQLVQAAAAVGSFAASKEGLLSVIHHRGLLHLLKVLQSSEDVKVVEAAVRAVKSVCRTADEPILDVLSPPSLGVLPRLVSLLASPTSNVAESSAAVLACCCDRGREQQNAVAVAGAVQPLVALLASQQHSKQEAALAALAALSSGNAATSEDILEHASVLSSLLGAIKRGRSPHTRFVAAVCLVNLSQHIPALGQEELSTPQGLQQAVLPVLVQLLDADMAENVPGALCQLVEHSAELQLAAADADAVAKLCAILRQQWRAPPVVEGALRCLAALCSKREEQRRQVVDARVLPVVVAALSHQSLPMRAAACMCMRSLSRSTKLLRGHLGDVQLAAPLLALVDEGDTEVAAQAMGTLTNLAVDFSAVKEQLLAHDGVARFAALADSMQPVLRLHGVWGLSSVAYMAAPEVKQSIAHHLPWSSVVALLEDSEPEVREKVMLLLRNMLHSERNIEAVLTWSCNALLEAARDVLQRSEGQAAAELKHHALYVVVNMASSTAAHKEAVMQSGWPPLLVQQLRDENEQVREAAVWAIINLTWSRDGDAEETAVRVQQLRLLGVEEELRRLEQDECIAVKERASTALDQLRALEGGGDDDVAMEAVV
ncbi:hypothetical protein D9Q98_003231 [Chlorella vulgaris]|uniref:Armadillo repeat-containing protein 8 n=1 Tax=Chlorella vulgaris TaxID=3077 RepID=A0A9D4TS79_CHLVU|nr:hypothetical protein D9Q98_003231 [Chlorella vulgaris]